MRHGTFSAYNKGCRCEACRARKRQQAQAYYERNRDTMNAQRRAWQDANPEKFKTYQQRWYAENRERLAVERKQQRETNPELTRERNRRYYQKHREKRLAHSRERYHASDKAAHCGRVKAWKKTPAGKAYVSRANSIRYGTPYTEEAIEWIVNLVDPECHYCGNPATEIDHVVPVTRGGTGERDNLVPACRSCNASKNNRLLSEWKGAPVGTH